MEDDGVLKRYRPFFHQRGFTLEFRLGRGSSGIVFRANQASLNRPVAIKVFNTWAKDAAVRKRFEREAVLLGKLDHPSIPYVLTAGKTVGQTDEVPYHVMQFVGGIPLTEILKGRTLAWRDAVRLLLPVVGATACAAIADIAHRDVAPDNIMVDSGERVFLVDFSIGVSAADSTEAGLTRTTEYGRSLGRTHYASPEQLKDAATVTPKTDVFSLGVILVEMLSGSPELRGAEIDQRLGVVPPLLRQSISRALNPDPQLRISSLELEALLKDCLQDQISVAVSPEPATAICVNARCRSVDRILTERGFIRGPRVIPNTTDAFCKHCGGRLTKRCPGCAATLPEDLASEFLLRKGSAPASVHCRACGHLIATAPSCRSCGSLLRDGDLERDTRLAGCSKCDTPPPPDAPF